MKQGKLQTAKNIAVKMLYEDIIPYDAYDGLFVYHPFFNSTCLLDSNGLFDYRCEPERLHKLQMQIEEHLNNANRVKKLLFYIQNAFKIDYIYELYKSGSFSNTDCGILLRYIWTQIENNELQPDDVTNAMERWLAAVPKKKLMDNEDYQVYQSFQEQITVYRGIQKGETAIGFSWSTDKKSALWFASRFNTDNPNAVCQLTVSKSDILFYTNDADEHDVVLLPSKINTNDILMLKE